MLTEYGRMTEPHQDELFPAPKALDADRQSDPTTGLLPSQTLREAVAQGREIRSPQPIGDDPIQPASIDLRLGEVAYRVRASFLPGKNSTVEKKIQDLKMSEVDLSRPAVFERNCVYIVPLVEELLLPEDVSAKCNPKSTTGRLDIFTRLITDFGEDFEWVRNGYRGKLYAEVVPRTFSVVLTAGM